VTSHMRMICGSAYCLIAAEDTSSMVEGKLRGIILDQGDSFQPSFTSAKWSQSLCSHVWDWRSLMTEIPSCPRPHYPKSFLLHCPTYCYRPSDCLDCRSDWLPNQQQLHLEHQTRNQGANFAEESCRNLACQGQVVSRRSMVVVGRRSHCLLPILHRRRPSLVGYRLPYRRLRVLEPGQ
jgi:hypothetical protein